MDFVKNCLTTNILEVGNVLSHYYPVKWDVVDKFEVQKGVINCDVVDYRPPHKYDLVISISTLEHVGYDEEDTINPNKIIKAIDNLRNNCLNRGGRIIITLPIGYNKEMDKLLFAGKLGLKKTFYLKRISRENLWEEVNFDEIKDSQFGKPYPFANALLIGIIE